MHVVAQACPCKRAHNGDMVQNVVFKWKVHMGQLVDESMPPLKVLCLHGFMQNGGVFRTKTGSFRKVCSPHFAQMWQFIIHFQAFKNCDFIFPDAPHPPSEVVFKQAPGEQAAAAGIKKHFDYIVLPWSHTAEDNVSGGDARAWYGWHPNRDSCVSFTGIEESLRLILQARHTIRVSFVRPTFFAV